MPNVAKEYHGEWISIRLGLGHLRNYRLRLDPHRSLAGRIVLDCSSLSGNQDREGESAMMESNEMVRLVEQLCRDLNGAHDEIMQMQNCTDPQKYDWPEWTPQANSIRWAEKMLQKKLAKTNAWTLFPEAGERAQGGMRK